MIDRFSLIVALALVAGSPAAGAEPAGDPKRGKSIYGRCIGCHALTYNRTGPLHCGLFGRRAGTVPGFRYSRAMRRSGIVWTHKTLDRFLKAPLRAMPGTRMGYAGVKRQKDRTDLIAYLAWAEKNECK